MHSAKFPGSKNAEVIQSCEASDLKCMFHVECVKNCFALVGEDLLNRSIYRRWNLSS